MSATHTFGDITLELVKDLLYGLHMRLQVLVVLRHSGHGCRQDGAQVKVQQAVHGVAGKRALRGGNSSLVSAAHDARVVGTICLFKYEKHPKVFC